MFSFLLDKYLGMELLGFMVTEEPLDCCTKWLHRITFPPALYEGSNPVTSLTFDTVLLFFIIVTLVVVK